MDIRTIEKDVLTKAKNNINPSTSSQLARELQQKWGKYAFDITNKLQKQGYLVRCDFFFGGDFWLGYLTPAGTEYLKELNYSAKKEQTNIYQNNFNSAVSVTNLQQGDHNSIIESKNEVDYSALLKTIEKINDLKLLYMKAEDYNPDFYKTLDELQESTEKKESYGKLKKIWNKLQNILGSNSVSNISSIISTIIAACTAFKWLKLNVGGEKAVADILDKYFIVRIAWVFGVNGSNFIKTMLKVGSTHDEVKVVDDQIGTPTYTLDLACLLVDMIETDKYGYYHATNSELPATESGYDENGTKTGYISWYDFTKEIYRQAGYDTKVTPVTTAEYGLSKAVRPFNSRLDKSKLVENGFKPLPLWTDAVSRYLEILKKQGFFDELDNK